MKKFTFKGVLDGFRQTVQPQAIRQEQEIHEQLKPEHFALRRTFRHGFPYSPTAFSFDPVQRLLAIGDKSGHIRILGRPGVDAHAKHEGESECAVIFSQFIINEGLLVTVTADDTLHLWSVKQKTPQVVQSLKFQRERVTCLHLPLASKWLYVGTEKGNIHVVHIDSFSLSGYVINWNKAIEVANHPGAVIALCDNPIDANKLLIAYECGLIVYWDLKAKCAEIRWQSAEPAKSIAWHHEGRYFVSSHTDGSICSWPTRPTRIPQSHVFPHAKSFKDGNVEKCKSIYKVDLKTTQFGDTFTIFCGGMPTEKGTKSNCITVMIGKTTTVLEMEHAVMDFITLCENPWSSEPQEPYAIAVLLQYDLVLIDLHSPGFPCFESPYPMDLHESPVTCCTYLTDCPSDLVPAFYSVGRTTTNKKTGFSTKEWPISGGEWSPASCSYSEIVITGHQDGSLKFWDSGAGTLQILYKLKTGKIFEKPKNIQTDNSVDNPLSIQLIFLCSESRRLCVAGAMGQVLLFKFRKVESTSEVLILEIPILYENFDDIYGTSPECDFIPHQVQKTESSDSDKIDNLLKVKCGAQRKPPGFQSQLVCLTTGPNKRTVQVTSLCINSSYGLMAYGTEYGLVIIDIIQKVCLLSVACPDLYGPHDPYSRTPKSPKRIENKDEQTRSPSSDQLNDTTSPDSPSIEFIAEVNNGAVSTSNQNRTITSRPTTPDNKETTTTTLSNIVKSPCGGGGGGGSEDVVASGATTEVQDRRKSISWKAFNFKRQLSKVNMKIGLNMNADNEQYKGNSVFYTQKESSPEETTDSSLKDATGEDESRDTMRLDEKQCAIPKANEEVDEIKDLGEFLFMDTTTNANQNTQLTKTNEKIATENLDAMPGTSSTTTNKHVDFANDSSDDVATPRPNNLPLASGGSFGQSDKAPVKPQRQRLKDKREQRLLSVPNIKYQPRETRSKLIKNDASPSISGNITKKLRTSPHERRNTDMTTSDTITTDSYDAGISSKQSLNEQASTSSVTTNDNANEASGTTTVIGNETAGACSQAPVQHQFSTTESLKKSKSQEKIDGTFSRSRSSSISSIDMSSSESVTCLSFIESYTKKNDILAVVPTLWIGTSFGSILTLLITMPEREQRKSQPVLITINGGPIVRLKGSITSMSFLDSCGSLMPYSFEPWRDDSREGKRDRTPTKSSNKTSPTFTPTTANIISNTSAGNICSSTSASSSGISGSVSTGLDTLTDRQYLVIASEKQMKVVDIANQCCINRIQLSEMDFAVKAETISMKDGSCLATYLSNGHLMVHSLPSLKPLLDTEFLPLMQLSFQTKCKQGIVDPMLSIWGQQIIVHEDTTQISRIFCFSHKGHGLYMASPTEIQKFTISSEFCQFIVEMMGELYAVKEMPEQPKESFFKGLFGGGAKSLDREELFGEQSGKANRSVARIIPGTQVEQLGQRASTAASEISRAHQLAMERGEKLNQLEERAERMANTAQDFTGTAHQLMLKYKDKKWYQL